MDWALTKFISLRGRDSGVNFGGMEDVSCLISFCFGPVFSWFGYTLGSSRIPWITFFCIGTLNNVLFKLLHEIYILLLLLYHDILLGFFLSPSGFIQALSIFRSPWRCWMNVKILPYDHEMGELVYGCILLFTSFSSVSHEFLNSDGKILYLHAYPFRLSFCSITLCCET